VSALYLLIGASICVAGCFLLAFMWNVKNGQYDDQQGSAMRMLHTDEPIGGPDNTAAPATK
jgi:cbb3-type cytochrome oxidase maturation protein